MAVDTAERANEESLRALLAGANSSAQDTVDALAERRRLLRTAGGDSLDVARHELQFLIRQASAPGAPDDLRDDVAAARRRMAQVDLHAMEDRAADDPTVLFDLAELEAECRACGFVAEAARAQGAIEQRALVVDPSLPAFAEEARERWAALASSEDDLPLAHKSLLLERTADVMGIFAGRGRSEGRLFGSLERRLRRLANEVGLQERVEGLLGRRMATAVETLSFVFLLVVMVLICVELFVLDEAVDAALLARLRIVDGAICVFFIAEFFMKFALAPRRGSWFWRNVLIDLLPAIPAALLLVMPATGVVAGQENVAGLRALRVFRIVQIARYIQAIQPVLRLVRLLLFLVRGFDGLMRRFRGLLNRNFVFFEPAPPVEVEGEAATRRLVYQALRREHVLLQDTPRSERYPMLRRRAAELSGRLADARPDAEARTSAVGDRDVAVDQAVEFLYELEPEDLGQWMPKRDVRAVDRVVRVLNAPLVRSLPLIRSLRLEGVPEGPEERVVAFGKRVAARLEAWQGRLHFTADLHGIVTGPQILDRVASAMIKASQRPAVRLLLFGGLFTLVRLVLGDVWGLGAFLGKFVATPLVVLGSVCVVFLALGRWLKVVAGEAADTFKLTSEAHFVGLLDLVKRRHEGEDLEFLARRLFRWELPLDQAQVALLDQVREIRRGHDGEPVPSPPELQEDLHRAALLYLHFLDGAILHESDVKTTEQLLANLSMENIRQGHLGFGRKDRRRLRRLALQDGSMFGGPYIWFRFITESVAVETAKRITEYNRHCLTLEQRKVASTEQLALMDAWLAKKSDDPGGRSLEKLSPPGKGELYCTTEFNALDFLAGDADRDRRLERVFGETVVRALARDRAAMIREIFGTRPVHRLPKSKRSVNFYRFYSERLSAGRVFLAPLYMFWASFQLGGRFVGKTRQIVREILRPHVADLQRVSGKATFAVALRKIHRMKAPGLLEAMTTRTEFDPAYCGAPPTWSDGLPFEESYELERDMDFLDLKEREREPLRRAARRVRRRVGELHGLVQGLADLGDPSDSVYGRRQGERAVTISFVTNHDDVRDLARAEGWLEDTLPIMEDAATRIQVSMVVGALLAIWNLFWRHPVDRWVDRHLGQRQVSRRGRRNFKRAWRADRHAVRPMVRAWSKIEQGEAPSARAAELCRRTYRRRHAVSRELSALRTVQSLSVLDVRNYRRLVFQLGDYAADGEDPAQAEAMP